MTVGKLREKLSRISEKKHLAVNETLAIVTFARDFNLRGCNTTKLICYAKGDGATVGELLEFIKDIPDAELVTVATIGGRDIFTDELIVYGDTKGDFRYI